MRQIWSRTIERNRRRSQAYVEAFAIEERRFAEWGIFWKIWVSCEQRRSQSPPPEVAPRNMSLLMLASPLSFMLPAAHGALADHLGFEASFALALLAVLTALFLLYKLPFRRAISG